MFVEARDQVIFSDVFTLQKFLVPVSDTACQDVLSFLRNYSCCCVFELGVDECPGEALTNVNHEVSKATDPLYFKFSDEQRLTSRLSFVFPWSRLCEVVVFKLTLHPAGPSSNFRMVFVLVGGDTLMCKQCVEDGAKDTPL